MSPKACSAPFADLSPDRILEALESAGFPCDGRLMALNSYENRVYQVGMDDGPMRVAKFYRPGRWSNQAILEEHGFMRELSEAELPVVPPLADANGATLHEHGGFRFAVFPRQGGYAPEFDHADTLRRMGSLIGRLHALGALRPYRERPALDIHSFGEEPREYLMSQDLIPADLRDAYRDVSALALDRVRRCFERAGEVFSLRLHGDCYAGNVLWTDTGPYLVDFDDSRMGPAMQDLWMLLSGSPVEMGVQINHLLAGYETFFEFDRRELHLVEALRTLRLIHYSAWIARRWDDPAFPAGFPWFASPRYWQDRILELREQIAAMDEPLLGYL
ncbi:serine/threonine protein kinase [Methyloterricola oryzae]|uniref:serine/threonine protein kinase n=1 Tax=Methyloterricola oryzae TaxID=1495050 RepID=UPI0005EB9449|nr:serine/threonine protein kinase [Methyloterricola oryzae]